MLLVPAGKSPESTHVLNTAQKLVRNRGKVTAGRDIFQEISVRNYHYSLCDNPKERSSHLPRDGSMKSQIFYVVSQPAQRSILPAIQLLLGTVSLGKEAGS
jgi:hypothetical protein